MADDLPDIITGTQDILEEMRRQELQPQTGRAFPHAPYYDPKNPDQRVAPPPTKVMGTPYEQATGAIQNQYGDPLDINPLDVALGVVPGPGMVRLPPLPNPIRAYHGTWAGDMPKFRRKLNDVGVHFGDAGQASDRLQYLSTRPGEPRTLDNASIIPVDLHMRNPLRLPDLGFWDADNLSWGLRKAWQMEEPLRGQTDAIRQAMWSSRSPLGQLAALRDLIMRRGHDGIVYRNTGEVYGSEPYRLARDQAWQKLIERRKAEGKPLNSYDAEAQQTPEYRAMQAAEAASNRFREENAKDSYIAIKPGTVRSATTGRVLYGLAPLGAAALAPGIVGSSHHGDVPPEYSSGGYVHNPEEPPPPQRRPDGLQIADNSGLIDMAAQILQERSFARQRDFLGNYPYHIFGPPNLNVPPYPAASHGQAPEVRGEPGVVFNNRTLPEDFLKRRHYPSLYYPRGRLPGHSTPAGDEIPNTNYNSYKLPDGTVAPGKPPGREGEPDRPDPMEGLEYYDAGNGIWRLRPKRRYASGGRVPAFRRK